MISFKEYCGQINEDWGKTSPIPKEVYDFPKYTEITRNKKELQDLIKERIEREGVKADLNDIDVSQITDMSYMFLDSEFNGDISNWNVGRVRDMRYMFDDSPLEKNPPKWYKE